MNSLTELHNSTGLLVQGKNGVEMVPEAAQEITDFLKFVKDLKKKEETFKQMLLEEMEKNGVVKIQTPDLLISYVAPTDRETLDTKLLKTECPDVYDAYCRISAVAASVRIKLK